MLTISSDDGIIDINDVKKNIMALTKKYSSGDYVDSNDFIFLQKLLNYTDQYSHITNNNIIAIQYMKKYREDIPYFYAIYDGGNKDMFHYSKCLRSKDLPERKLRKACERVARSITKKYKKIGYKPLNNAPTFKKIIELFINNNNFDITNIKYQESTKGTVFKEQYMIKLFQKHYIFHRYGKNYKVYLFTPNPEYSCGKFNSACRKAIVHQISSFKKDRTYGEYVEHRDGHLISKNIASVDHIIPLRELIIKFIAQYGIDISNIEYRGTNNKSCRFKDKSISLKFIEFHKKYANLQILTKSENVLKN